MLAGLGLSPIKRWAARCKWYKPDGSFHAELPSDMYSRLLYMGRGLRPEIGIPSRKVVENASVTLLDAVVDLMSDKPKHVGTASEILNVLEGMVAGMSVVLPIDATRFSIALFELASQLEDHGIEVRRLTRGKNRGIKLLNRHYQETVDNAENP